MPLTRPQAWPTLAAGEDGDGGGGDVGAGDVAERDVRARCEEHGLAAVDRGGELLLDTGSQVQPDRADAGAVQAATERSLRASPLTW